MTRGEVQDRLLVQQAGVRADFFESGMLGLDGVRITPSAARLGNRLQGQRQVRPDHRPDPVDGPAVAPLSRAASNGLVIVNYLQLASSPRRCAARPRTESAKSRTSAAR